MSGRIIGYDLSSESLREQLIQQGKKAAKLSKRNAVLSMAVMVVAVYLFIGLGFLKSVGDGRNDVPYNAFFLAPWKVTINFIANHQHHDQNDFGRIVKGN
jgi:hypothetical protein